MGTERPGQVAALRLPLSWAGNISCCRLFLNSSPWFRRARHEMRREEGSYRAPAARIAETDKKAAIRFALVAAFKGARGSL